MILQVDFHEVKPGTAVVDLVGALTLGTSLHAADARLQQALQNGLPRLVLNMAGVPYMDSAGLGVLINASGMARGQGGELRLCSVSDRVLTVIKMTRTESLLPIDVDVDASLAALN